MKGVWPVGRFRYDVTVYQTFVLFHGLMLLGEHYTQDSVAKAISFTKLMNRPITAYIV